MSSTSTRLPLSPLNKSMNSNIPTFQKAQPSLSTSRIPVNNMNEANRWKHKFEDAEQKRKILLTENVKMLRLQQDLQKKHSDLQEKHECLETELFEKNEEFTKLTTASKNLYREYEKLKNQYDIETLAMSSALKDASQWYKQNKELKRKTLLLCDKDTVDEGVDAGDTTPDSDIENLNKTIKRLSAEVATLQTEVDCLKQSESAISVENVKLLEELEKERERTNDLEQELLKSRQEYEQLIRISELMKKEIQDLKAFEEVQRNDVVILRKEAGDYKRERNVLAHQSTLLLKGIAVDDADKCMGLLQEIEELKRAQEEQRTKHEDEINNMQEKLEDQMSNSRVEVLEERLKLFESDLQVALRRAEKAECELETLKKPAVPPPPPPLPLLFDNEAQAPVVPLRVKRKSRINLVENINIESLEKEENKKAAQPNGVNTDIINAIKEGKFTLKKTKSLNKRERDGSKTVSEILNILSTLKRTPKKRQSIALSEPQA